MRRKEPLERCSKVFIIFTWTECYICDDQVRREWMYQGDTPLPNRRTDIRHVCNACATDAVQANKLIVDKYNELMNSRPPPPGHPSKVLE